MENMITPEEQFIINEAQREFQNFMKGELKGDQERYFDISTEASAAAAREINNTMPIKHTPLENGGKETFFGTNVPNVVSRQVTYPDPNRPISETLIRLSNEGYDKRFSPPPNSPIKST